MVVGQLLLLLVVMHGSNNIEDSDTIPYCLHQVDVLTYHFPSCLSQTGGNQKDKLH